MSIWFNTAVGLQLKHGFKNNILGL